MGGSKVMLGAVQPACSGKCANKGRYLIRRSFNLSYCINMPLRSALSSHLWTHTCLVNKIRTKCAASGLAV